MDYQDINQSITVLGKIKIAPQVIEVITKLSALEVSGVADLSGGFTDEIVDFLGRGKGSAKGIKVEIGEKETAIDISVVIKYGYNIPELALSIQENVKYAVETMTALDVKEVNVHINGIKFDE